MIYFFCGSYIKLYFCHILLRSFPFCLKKKSFFDLFCVKGIQSLITSCLSLESFCFYSIFLWLLSPNQTCTSHQYHGILFLVLCASLLLYQVLQTCRLEDRVHSLRALWFPESILLLQKGYRVCYLLVFLWDSFY